MRRSVALSRPTSPLFAAGAASFVVVAVALVFGLPVVTPSILQWLADVLVVRQAPAAADAVVVLGGGARWRPQTGIALLRAG